MLQYLKKESMSTGVEPTITLTEDGEWWIAEDTETGVVSQGKTRTEALDNLDEALEGYHGAGETPDDAALRDAGIDPENNVSGAPDNDIFEL